MGVSGLKVGARPSTYEGTLPAWPALPAKQANAPAVVARRDVLDAIAKRLPVEVSADRALGALEDLADELAG
jgi:hypothetical protein